MKQNSIESAKLEQVIHIRAYAGNGTAELPSKMVDVYYTLEGKLIGAMDITRTFKANPGDNSHQNAFGHPSSHLCSN